MKGKAGVPKGRLKVRKELISGMPPPEIDFIAALSVLNIQPGDTLVLTCSTRLSADRFKLVKDNMKRIFPETNVLILDDGATLSVTRVVKIEELINGTH